MKFEIRKYEEKDWEAICYVHDRSRPDELRGSYDLKAFIPLAEDPEGEYIAECEMYVAVLDLQIIGFAGIDAPYFAWLYVDPDYYGNGVGRKLLQHCLKKLSAEAWTLACGNNVRAIKLYESEGFKIEKRYIGENAGYSGSSVRLALNPELKGWEKKRKAN